MLYLKLPAGEHNSNEPRQVPITESTALRLERVLLSDDDAARRSELSAACAADSDFAHWALRTAEIHSGTTINHTSEAVAWLSNHFETEAANSIAADDASAAGGVFWRLPRLVTKLQRLRHETLQFEQRLEREKLESLKELAYGASHEINNPLANIATRAQSLLDDETDPERQRKLTAIYRQAMRAHEMISDLMLFARPPKLKLAMCDLRRVAQDVATQLGDFAAEHDVQLQLDLNDEAICCACDETQITVAVHALVINSIEACSGGGHVRASMRRVVEPGASYAEIRVDDDGPGISDTVRAHIFDPFFSGREAGRGLGFGLSKCWRIVTDHGGRVVVHDPHGGAAISILLPLDPKVEHALDG